MAFWHRYQIKSFTHNLMLAAVLYRIVNIFNNLQLYYVSHFKFI